MKSKTERDVEKALRKARELAERADAMTEQTPASQRNPILRSTSAMATNLAMALDVLQRQRGQT